MIKNEALLLFYFVNKEELLLEGLFVGLFKTSIPRKALPRRHNAGWWSDCSLIPVKEKKGNLINIIETSVVWGRDLLIADNHLITYNMNHLLQYQDSGIIHLSIL